MFKPLVGDGGSQIAVEVSPGVGDLSVLLPELDCAEPRNTLDVSGNFFWVRWCELGQATLSVNDTATGVGQSYPITVVEPTPTPMPTATPTPGPPHDPTVRFNDLWGASAVHQDYPEREHQIRELPWVADGLLYTEHRAARGLIYLALYGGDYFAKFMAYPWVAQGKNMPAIEATGLMAASYPEEFQKVIKHPTMSDGLDGQEVLILPTLRNVAEHNPALIEKLLDPDQVIVEKRHVDLPLTGSVELVIIRLEPGAERTMDLVEIAARTAEDLYQYPLPRRQIIHIFADAVLAGGSGHNRRDHIVNWPVYDNDSADRQRVISHLVHETTHYYQYGREGWVTEGVATFAEAWQITKDTDWPLVPSKPMCPYHDHIAEFEKLNVVAGEESDICHYSLGERVFQDLYRELGEETFREGLRRLYLLRVADDPRDDCQGPYMGLCHVATAFKAGITEETAQKVDQVLACWYYGDQAACPATGSSDPQTPLLGPLSGTIPHRPNYDGWELSRGFSIERDVMLEVTFENPEPPAGTHWIYGLYLKSMPGWSSHRIFLNSWGTWYHSYYSAATDRYGAIEGQSAPSIDRAPGGENQLRLIKIGDTGWLYINERFAGNINFTLGNMPAPSQVFLVLDDETEGVDLKRGHATHFRDYTIWKWHPDLFELPRDD